MLPPTTAMITAVRRAKLLAQGYLAVLAVPLVQEGTDPLARQNGCVAFAADAGQAAATSPFSIALGAGARLGWGLT